MKSWGFENPPSAFQDLIKFPFVTFINFYRNINAHFWIEAQFLQSLYQSLNKRFESITSAPALPLTGFFPVPVWQIIQKLGEQKLTSSNFWLQRIGVLLSESDSICNKASQSSKEMPEIILQIMKCIRTYLEQREKLKSSNCWHHHHSPTLNSLKKRSEIKLKTHV